MSSVLFAARRLAEGAQGTREPEPSARLWWPPPRLGRYGELFDVDATIGQLTLGHFPRLARALSRGPGPSWEPGVG